MTLLKFKPTSPGCRGKIKILNNNLFLGRPNKKLIKKKNKSSGRNNNGRITVRHIGGKHKRYYRIIDFLRNKNNIFSIVKRIEYDPNRSAHIALLYYLDGEKRYILSPKGLLIGDKIISGNIVPIKIGNSMPIKNIPVGVVIHCVEIFPGKGAQIARTAGSGVILMSKEKEYSQIRLRSGEIRLIHINCRATIGEIGNTEHNLQKLGKAGSKRWRGIRPTVRGVAMNPIDHPHGGGEGRTAAGRHPVSPWGKQTKGKKTRRNKKTSSMIIIKRFKKNKG